MPDEITIKPKSESTVISSTSENQTVSLGRTQLVNLCALGLGVSFFLPWAHVFFGSPSGFDLQKLGDEQRFLWLIPIFCMITVIASVNKRAQQIAAQLTGLLPFIVGIYWYSKIGKDMFQVLAFGAYLSLIFGAAMFVMPRKSK